MGGGVGAVVLVVCCHLASGHISVADIARQKKGKTESLSTSEWSLLNGLCAV